MSSQKTKTDTLFSWFKNHWLLAPIIVVGAIIITLATFTESVQILVGLGSSFLSSFVVSEERPNDKRSDRSVHKDALHLPQAAPLVPEATNERDFKDVESDIPALPPDQPMIRERSAGEIVRNLANVDPLDIEENVDELYRGRWTQWPGWRALPR